MDLDLFSAHFRENFPDLCGRRILVALSGGADSTALLHLLRLPKLQLELVAVHIHHGLRGIEADEDAEFCRRQCEALEIPVEILHPAPERRSGSLEADWRRVRYRELEAAAHRCDASAIATGHHQDDVAEGLLLQMLRGGGLRSMAGIHSRREKIIRPLLPFSRQQLLDWLGERALPWVRDGSNVDPAHLRNRVRHEALPCLERIAPTLRRQLVALSSQIAVLEDWMAEALGRAPFINPWAPGGIDAEAIASLPGPLRSRWLQELCRREGLGACRRSQIEAFPALFGAQDTSLNLPSRWRLKKYRERLYLEASGPVDYSFPVEAGGEFRLPLRGWTLIVWQAAGRVFPPSPWRMGVDSLENLRIRSPVSGDRLEGGRKVSELLRGIRPLHLRWSWPILTKNDKILWIPGIAVKGDDSTPEWIVEVEQPCQK